MGKLAAFCLFFLILGCAWSQYYQGFPPPPPQRIIYRHHFPAFHPPTPYINPVQVAHSYQVPYAVQMPQSPLIPRVPAAYVVPAPSQPAPQHIPYNPAPVYQSSYYSPPRSYYPPPRSPPQYAPYPSYPTGYPNYSPRPAFLNKIKPFLFGQTSPKSLPHHPFYPNHYHPHHYTPKKGFHNQQPHFHGHNYNPMNQMHQMHHMHGSQQHSCSCSLHVNHLTVYKHIDMRASYSCRDLKDCNSFCTNLFSSEDLRAQTRSDACLMIGKDGSYPWFRRDQVCGHYGVYNDTKLSVDLCCKDLQPC